MPFAHFVYVHNSLCMHDHMHKYVGCVKCLGDKGQTGELLGMLTVGLYATAHNGSTGLMHRSFRQVCISL